MHINATLIINIKVGVIKLNKIKNMNKTYIVWYRVTKGDLSVQAIVRATDIQNALDKIMQEYPQCEVKSLREEEIEII